MVTQPTRDRIKDYEILNEVGSGSFGVVYRAYQPILERDVAIKMIHPEYSGRPEFAAHFEREARLVAQLEHPHIVPLYEYWSDETGAFLAMRWLTGNLRQAINYQPLSLVNCVRLLEQIGDALSMAHIANIIHCDIKPDNVLHDHRGNFYLGDFGIARKLLLPKGQEDPIGGMRGTLAYIAPEQIQGASISPRTDIYSLGITLYEALAGEHPYPTTLPDQLMKKHLQEPMPSIVAKRPSLPKAINDVLQKATAKNPEERYSVVHDLVSSFSSAANLSSGVKPAMGRQMSEPYDAFLSYKRNESAVLALSIRQDLSNRGINAFVDVKDIRQAGQFERVLRKAIGEANHFVCFLGRTTLESPYVLKEIECAHSLGKNMIPVFLEDYRQPKKSPPHVEALLSGQGVRIFDRQGIYMDAAIDQLAQLIESTPLTVADELTAVKDTREIEEPRPKTLRTLEERNRYYMLSNVRRFWIEGVLEKSLYNTGIIELGISQRFGEVDNPWEEHLQAIDAEVTLPPSTHMLDVFDKFNGKMLVLGEPGGGKTTMLLALARDLLERAEADDAHPIPIILNLSSWSEEQMPLQDWLMDELRNQYQVGSEIADLWLRNDQVQLLLDGLDEVSREHREGCVEAINRYRQEHGLVDMVICARTGDYRDLSSKLQLNGAMVLEPLTDEQVDLYLAQLGKEMQGVRQLLTEDTVLREMSRSPLMLSIITLAYRDLSADVLPGFKTVIAHRKYIFDTYIKRLFERRRQGHYSQEETSHYLGWLARKMQDHNQSVFLIEKMQPSWLTKEQRQQYYSFFRWLHIPSTAAVYGLPCLFIPSSSGFVGWMLGLLLAVVGMIVAWVYTGPNWQKLSHHALIGISYGIAWGLSAVPGFGTLAGLILGIGVAIMMTIAYTVTTNFISQDFDKDRIAIVEKLDFSFKKVNPLYGVAGSIIGLLGVLAAFIALGSPSTSPARVIVSAVIGAIVFGAFWLLNSGLSSIEITLRKRPNEAILRAVRNSYGVFFITAVMYLLYTLVAIAPVTSVQIGLLAFLGLVGANGYPFWFIYGGFTTLQHLALRLALLLARVTPLNYARFLDYASLLILMRKVGGGYIFIHRYLMNYFASEAND